MRECLLVLVLVSVATSTSHAQEGSLIVGTWRTNVEQSTYSPGPPPKSQTRVYEDRGDGTYLIRVQTIAADGAHTIATHAYKYDGLDYPLAELNATTIRTVALRRKDPHTVELTFKNDGRTTITAVETISKDGKTMSYEAEGKNAQGQAVNNRVVLEKQ